MADILERLGNDSKLGKVLLELLGEIATSAVSKGNKQEEKDADSPSFRDAPYSKSVPVSPKEGITTPRLTKSDDESEKERTVDPSLGRPRYQWHVADKCSKYEKDLRKSTAELKELFSVYVGHLPNDITEDELVDLFKDTGEIINAYVFPNNANNYTYGFVRFLTLDEAKDAIRDKHLKLIGNMQIHVELSADTRRKTQDNDTLEESHQLLRKDYPKVVRRPVDDGDEKKVIAKVKTSLRKLNTGSCVLGECSSEELFENIKAIVKMIIDYPMSLADAIADEGKLPSRNIKTLLCNKEQPRGCDNDAASFPMNEGSLVPSFPKTRRLPAPAACNPNSMFNNTDKHHEKSDTSPLRDVDRPPSLPTRQVIEAECTASNYCPLVNKVRHSLDSSSSENIAISNDLPFAENSESCSSPDSWSTCEMQAGSVLVEGRDDLGSFAPQHGMNDHVDVGIESLGRLDDGRTGARPYENYREKDVMAFDSQTKASSMPSNDVGYSSRQNVHQINYEPFVEDAQRADTVFVSCDQLQPKAVSMTSKDVSHCNSSQQNMHQTNYEPLVEATQRADTVFVSCNQQPKASPMSSNDVSHCNSSRQNMRQTNYEPLVEATQRADTVFVSCNQQTKALSISSNNYNNSQQNTHLTNGSQFVADVQRTGTVFVSCDQIPKTSLLTSNGASHWNRSCSQLNVHQTNGEQCIEARERTDVTFVSLNQQPKVSSFIFNNTSKCNRFSSEMGVKLPSESTYPNVGSSVQSIGTVDDPFEVTKSDNFGNANENTAKALVVISPHLKSLERCGQPSVFSTVHCETAATKLSPSNSNHSNYMHVDSSTGTKLLEVDRSTFSSEQHSPTDTSDSRSAVLNSGSNSDSANVTKNEVVVSSVAFGNPSEETRRNLSPCIQDASSQCNPIDTNRCSSEKCTLSQSSRTALTDASDSRSAVLNSVSSGSNSDNANVTKSEVVISSVAFGKPSEGTRRNLPPCIQDASPSCNPIDTNSCTPRISQHDEIHISTFLECNSVSNTNGKLARVTSPPHDGTPSRDTILCSSETNRKGSNKDGVKSPCSHRGRTLAPSFSMPIVKRSHGAESKRTNVLPKVPSGLDCHNGSSSSEILRPSAAGKIVVSGSVKNKAGAIMTDDSAIVNVSKGNRDTQHLNLSPSHFEIDCGSRGDFDSGFESSVPRNNAEQCQKEDDAETKSLKENLKELYGRLEGLQQILSSRPRDKQKKTRQWFEDDPNSMELESQIHDAEVLLQKKNESSRSRSSEQELAFERETLQLVNNTKLLKQLSKEMEKEHLKNEISVTELKCTIVELKMRPFTEQSAIEI